MDVWICLQHRKENSCAREGRVRSFISKTTKGPGVAQFVDYNPSPWPGYCKTNKSQKNKQYYEFFRHTIIWLFSTYNTMTFLTYYTISFYDFSSCCTMTIWLFQNTILQLFYILYMTFFDILYWLFFVMLYYDFFVILYYDFLWLCSSYYTITFFLHTIL